MKDILKITQHNITKLYNPYEASQCLKRKILTLAKQLETLKNLRHHPLYISYFIKITKFIELGRYDKACNLYKQIIFSLLKTLGRKRIYTHQDVRMENRQVALGCRNQLYREKQKLEENISDLNNQLVEEQQKGERLKRTRLLVSNDFLEKSSATILGKEGCSYNIKKSFGRLDSKNLEKLDISDKHMQFSSSSLSSACAEDSPQLHRDTIVELQEKLDAKDTKIANLKSKLIEEQEAYTKKEEKIAIQGQKILTQEEEKLELQENLKELKENFKEVKEGYNQKEERILELGKSCEMLDIALKKQEELKDNFQKQLNEANEELKKAKRNVVEQNDLLTKLEEENLRLTSEKNESVKNADHFTNLSQEKDRRIECLENQLRKQAAKERQSLSTKEIALEEKVNAYLKKIDELQQKLDIKNETVKELQKELYRKASYKASYKCRR